MTYLPANIDLRTMIAELNTAGMPDYKIELICSFSRGYISQVKTGHIQQVSYQKAARLFNLHADMVKTT
jgi:hypothetical protein